VALHRFVADPTFHFDADPDPDPVLSWNIRKKFLTLIPRSASLHWFYFLVSVTGV
jgi:hypothetical protein